MAYSRNEYLQSLNRMRANYQSQGNPLVNREDDNGDVGNELSSFAYMQTEPVSTATEQASKANRNDWQRTVDTIGSAKSNIREGVVNFLDDVADFAIVTGSLLTGLIGGIGTWLFSDSHDFMEGWDTVTEAHQKATQFEWEPYVNEFLNQIDMEQAALSGDLFNGEWAQRWADIGNLEKNKQHIQELHQNSWASDWGEFGQGVQQVEQGVGYMLPSILLGVLTGGSSTAVQVGVQAAVAGGTALGSGFEQASKEGADYGQALLYGGTKGAVGAGIGALTTWVGGNVAASSGGTAVSNLGKKAGEQIFKTTGSKTAEVVTGKAIEIASQAGISGAKAFAMTMAEPAFKTLYNDKSLQESYSGENLNKTLELAKSSALTAMATSAVVGTLKEGAEFAKYGKDGYYAKYYTEKAQMMAVKDAKQLKKIQEYETSEKGKIEKRFNDGQITEKERDIALESLSKNVEAQTLKVKQNIENHTLKALQQGQEYVDRIQQQNKVKDLSKEDFRTLGRELRKKYHPDSGNVSSEKSALFNSTLDKLKALNANDNVGRLKVLNGIKDKEIKSDLTKLFPVSKYGNNEKVMTAFSNIKSNYKDLSTKLNFKWYETTNGDIGVKVDNNTDVTFGNDGKPYLLTYKGGDNNKEVQIKLESDKNAIVPTITKSNLSSTIEATSKINTAGFEIKLANIENKVLNIPEVESKGVNTKLPYSFSEDLNSKILNNTNSKEIMNFLDECIKGKGQDNYVVQAKEDSKYFVIEPFKQNGNDKYGIITINSKTNEITDISVKNSVPSKVSGTIVPKVEKPQANVSYLKNDDGKPLVFNVADFKNDSDIVDGTNKSFSAKPQEGENGEVVIYSKNPLKTLDIKKNIPFARVSKLFNIPSSLQKSYELKFDSKNELAPLNWVAKKSNLTIEQVIKKLGYDSIVKKDNSVTVFDGGKLFRNTNNKLKEETINKKASINLAVTYDENITNETFDKQIRKYKPKVESCLKEISDIFGISCEVGEAIGGWTFIDNANKVSIAGEPSFPIEVKNYKSIDELKLVASILADTAYEVQNSVGVIEYDENGGEVEDTFNLTKVDDGLNEVIKNAKLEGYTLYKNDKKLVVIGTNDATIDVLLTELENGGYLNDKHQATNCNASWLGLKERADLYQTWLKNGVGQEKGRIRSYVTKAFKINKYVIDRLDEEGHRIGVTENRASKIWQEIQEGNRPSSSKIIKNSANLKHEKVYKVKTTNQIVENALTNVIDKLPQGAKISVPQTKANLKDFVFQELNLAKDRDLAVKNIVEQIEQAVVTFNDENNNEQKVALSELGLKEDLTKAIEGLIAHKGELSEKSQWVKKYNDTVARYGKYVRERAELNSQYITAIKQQKTLDNIFKNAKQVNIGGDTSIKELSLYKQLTSNILLSNTRKNIAPSTFTKLVNNFSSYTKENFKDAFDPDIKNMVDQLSESFVDGKFPNREPTVGEMFLFNAIRGRIIVRCNNLKSKKTEAIHNQIRDTVLDASVALPNMTSGKFPKLINLANSTISVPVWFELHLGRDSYMTKLFTTEWNKHNSDFIAQRQKMYEEVLLELPKKAGLTSKKLTNTIKKTAIVLADRNGKEHKISVDYAAKAYCLYHSNNKEELLKTGLTIQNDKKSGKSYDFKLTESDYERMFKQIPEDVKNYLDLVLKDFCNGTLYDYRNKKNEAIFGVSMPRSDNYYWGERVGQVNTGSAPSALSGGYLSISNAKFLQTKVSNKNHFKWNSFLGDLTDVIDDTARWGEMSNWVDDVNHALNRTVPEAGNHTLEYYLRQVTGYDKFRDFMNKQIKGEPLSENKHTILSKIGNINQIALFGFNISASGKQLGSSPSFVLDPRVTIGNQIKSFFTGFKHIFHLKKIREELKQYSGFFVDRFENNDLINSFLVSEQAGKFQKFIAKVVLAPMEFIDSLIITTQGFEIATTILDEEIEQEIVSFKKGSAEYKKAHATLLSELVLRTQSNNVSMWKSPLRSGYKGEIERVVYGMFGSDNQNKIQAAIDAIVGKTYSDARAKAYEDSSKNEKYTKEQRDHFKEKAEQERNNYSGKKTAGKVVKLLTSLFMSGMIVVGVRELVDRLKGKKDWDEKIDVGAIMGDLALETFVNWIPYVGTIANAIENNSDVSAFTVSELNELVDSMKLIAKAFETGDKTDVRKAVLSLVVNGLKLTGIPARNVYQLIMGMWYQFDKEGSLSAQAWVKGYKSSYMKTLYTTAISNGNTKRAKAQLGAWSMAYSTNITDEATLTELVRLSKAGYNATPSSNMTSYTNDKGEKISFTNAQANAFKTEYAKSNRVVKELLNIEGYKKQDNKAKASMISKIYSAYRESAKGKALGVVPNSKLAQLAYYAGNDIAMAKYILFMQQLSVIKDDEKKTRKEKVIAEINKIRGLSKSEKLLLAYLSGYSVAETNLDRLTTYLVGKGFKKTDALSFLGAKK